MTSHRSAVLLLVAAAVCWSLGGLLVKSIEWPSLAKAGARSALAIGVMWIWLRRPQITWSPSQVGAAVAYAATVILFIVANDRTTAANAIFLQYTAPVYVALLGYWFTGERTRRIDWICIAVALAGIALFFRDDFTPAGLTGNIAALASGVSFALMTLLLRRQRDASPGSALLLGNILTAVIGLPFAIGHPLTPGGAGALLILGIVQLGIPYILYSIAIRRVTALEAILIPMLEPVLNPLWVVLGHGEVPGPWSLAGGALVIGTVLVRGLASIPRLQDAQEVKVADAPDDDQKRDGG